MLVWIPRYAYRIRTNYHTSTAGRIDIVFIDTNNRDRSGTSYSKTYPSATTGGSMSNYVVHPAFTYDGKEMAGFWVAKFETSQKSNGDPQIKAGAVSWRNIEIGDAFLQCANMNASGNDYNLESDADPHLTKNTEWGAIAYLCQNSTYGRGSDVGNNSNSSFYTGGGSGTAYRNNTNQSSTGNVTGVYDLKGGAWEFTAAFLGSPTDTAGAELTSADSKYYESYTQYGNHSRNGGHYGEAMYETTSEMPAGMFPASGSNQQASWYGERSMFPWSLAPYIVRGGDYAETDGGIFSCSFVPGGDGAFSGDTFAYTSFRVAIPCYNGILDN